MTEKEKMLAGVLYDANYDEELEAERMRCKDLCFDFNNTRPSQTERQAELLEQIVGTLGEDCRVTAPFWCDHRQQCRDRKRKRCDERHPLGRYRRRQPVQGSPRSCVADDVAPRSNRLASASANLRGPLPSSWGGQCPLWASRLGVRWGLRAHGPGRALLGSPSPLWKARSRVLWLSWKGRPR